MVFWNKNIGSLGDDCFGLDLSDFSVKVFQLEKNGSAHKIRSFGDARIPSGAIQDGKIIDKKKTSELIRNVVKEAGPKKINTKKVICSVPESKVFLRIINIPKVTQEEAANAVKWEIEASIPIPVDQVYYDWQVIDEKNGKMDLLTVAVSKVTVDGLMEVLENAGLMVYGLEMESIAVARSLIPEGVSGAESFLIIDIGEEKTSFIVTQGNVPHFTSSIPFSSSGITEQIANVLNISKEEAEKIKIEKGIEELSKDKSILNFIWPYLENLSVEIEKTIDFYQDMTGSSSKVEKIIISGGGANLKGIIPYFAIRLTKKVFLGNPWIGLKLAGKLPIMSKENSVRFSTAVGLAMRGIDYEY